MIMDMTSKIGIYMDFYCTLMKKEETRLTPTDIYSSENALLVLVIVTLLAICRYIYKRINFMKINNTLPWLIEG